MIPFAILIPPILFPLLGPDQIFHVLLHELAHCTVQEYSHSEKFWKNYLRLRDIAVEIGVYERIGGKQKFCGEHVSDE